MKPLAARAPIVLTLSSLGAGGAERVIAQLANHWTAAGHPVTVIAFDRPSDPVFHEFDPRVTLLRLSLPPADSRLAAPLRAAERVRKLREVLIDIGPAIVISFLLKINILVLIASRGLGIPVVVSERNHPIRGTGSRAWRWARGRLYPGAELVVLQTDASRAALPPVIARRSVVIPNPVTHWPRSPEPDLGGTLTAVGRLDPQKGFDLLLQAFAQVADRHRDWKLVIWGEGPLREHLESIRASLGLDDRVALPGISEQPGGWIASASAFVLSSRYEGFSNAVGEALAAGLPVVAFGCEFGVDELLCGGSAGLLIPAEDTDALAQGLDRIMSSRQLRADLATRAALSARRFTAEAILSSWDMLLGSVLDRVGKRRRQRTTSLGLQTSLF